MPEPPVDTWADPVAAADAAATSLLQRLDDGSEIATSLAALGRRNGEALVLTLAEAAGGPDPVAAVSAYLQDLRDWRWVDRLALATARSASFGVVSLGATTRRFLSEAADLAPAVPEVRTPSRAVARGLGYLGLPVLLTDPATAETVLVPAVARHRDRFWTTVPAAEAAKSAVAQARNLVVLCHPAAVLSSKTRLAFRPEPIMIDVRLPTGVTS